MTFAELRERFDRYADAFRTPEGVLPDAMQCKYDHTFDVVRYADAIASGEAFSAADRTLATVCALFHDVARFEQLKRFATFNDNISHFDHGHEGVRLLFENGFLLGLTPGDFETVLASVENHNKKTVAPGLPEPVLPFVKITRDADKLAILELTIRYFAGEIKLEDETLVALGNSKAKGFSPEIVEAAREGHPVSYSKIRSENDFKLCLFTWPADLNFRTSAGLVLERGFYDRVRSFLPDDPVCDDILFKVKERLQCLSSKSEI